MCLCRISTQGTPAFRIPPAGTSWSILIHQQFEQPRRHQNKKNKKAVFSLRERRKSDQKAEGKSKLLEKGESAGWKALELITWPCGGREGIFSHCSIFWSSSLEVWSSIISLMPEVEASEVCAVHQQSDSRVTSPRKPRESASLYLVFYIFSN